MIAVLIIDTQLNLVCLVDVDVMRLSFPTVIAGRLGASYNLVFNLDNDKCFWATRESACRHMICILHATDSDRELTGQWLT